MLKKAVDPDRAFLVEADLHRKFGEYRLSFRVGVRFHDVENEFYRLANGEYSVKENAYSFTLWQSMGDIPNRCAGPDLWTFGQQPDDLQKVIGEIDRFFLESAIPWMARLSEPLNAVEWIVANCWPHKIEWWCEAIRCYSLAKQFQLPIPKEPLSGIFACANSGGIGSSVCKRLIVRDRLHEL